MSGNRLRTGVGRLCPCLQKWDMAPFTACECIAEEQTNDHVVLHSQIHRTPHGVHVLMVLDDETIEWLLNTCPVILCGLAVGLKNCSDDEEEMFSINCKRFEIKYCTSVLYKNAIERHVSLSRNALRFFELILEDWKVWKIRYVDVDTGVNSNDKMVQSAVKEEFEKWYQSSGVSDGGQGCAPTPPLWKAKCKKWASLRHFMNCRIWNASTSFGTRWPWDFKYWNTAVFSNPTVIKSVPSPRGPLVGLAPKQSSKPPQIETWNTLNQWNFCQFLHWQAPCRTAKPPYWKLFGDGSASN